ncbi:MAG: tetratricopeptide repeat protein [Kiritimatiellae bacterium]|nr:tetratricopeptide repeat protein [Kiritimatiellia bacterium]
MRWLAGGLLLLSLSCANAVPTPAHLDSELSRAEALFREQRWTEAAAVFDGCAQRAPGAPATYAAIVKSGHCRLALRDDKGALKLFERVTRDDAAFKVAPDAAGAACEQLHLLLLKQGKPLVRERLIARSRQALPEHAAIARICEREGDARLEAGSAGKAQEYYCLAGAGLSATGTNAVRLLTVPTGGYSVHPLRREDAAALAVVGAAKPAVGLALCELLSRRQAGWRAEDARARILHRQGKYAEAVAVWERMARSKQGPADEISLAAAETRGFKLGEIAAALPLYERWLRNYGRSPLREKAEYQQAGLLWMSGDYASAVAEFERYLRAYPHGPYVGEARRTLERARADLTNLRQAKKLATAAQGDPLVGDLALGEQQIAQGLYAEALKALNRFRGRQAHPQWGRAWYGYGVCRRNLGEPDKALTAWEEVLRQAALFTNTQHAAECRRAKGDVWLEDLAEPDKALDAYHVARAALPAGATDPEIEECIGQALLALGRVAEARTIFEDFRRREAGDPWRARHWDGLLALCAAPAAAPAQTPEERRAETLRRVADVHFAAERWDKADAIYLRAAKVAPVGETTEWCDMQRARICAYLDEPQQALKLYDRFRTEHVKSIWADDVLLRAGVLCAGPLNDARRGAKYFREIIASYPNGDRAEAAYLYLATLAWWDARWEEAERLHRAFLEKYPRSPFKEEFLTVRLPAIAARRVVPKEQ